MIVSSASEVTPYTAMKVVGEARKVGIQLAVAQIFSNPRLGHVARSGLYLADNAPDPEDIKPLALLGDGFDVTALLQDVAASCDVTPATIQDILYLHTAPRGSIIPIIEAAGRLHHYSEPWELSPILPSSASAGAWEDVS